MRTKNDIDIVKIGDIMPGLMEDIRRRMERAQSPGRAGGPGCRPSRRHGRRTGRADQALTSGGRVR